MPEDRLWGEAVAATGKKWGRPDRGAQEDGALDKCKDMTGKASTKEETWYILNIFVSLRFCQQIYVAVFSKYLEM